MALKPIISTVVVTAGTPQVVKASTPCVSVYVEAQTANAGTIYVGDSTVSATAGYITKLAASAGFGISTDSQGRLGGEFQLGQLYIDGTNSGDKVQVTYLPRIDKW